MSMMSRLLRNFMLLRKVLPLIIAPILSSGSELRAADLPLPVNSRYNPATEPKRPWERLRPYGEDVQSITPGPKLGDAVGLLQQSAKRRLAIQQISLGDLYFRANDFDQSVSSYQRAVDLFPDQPEFHLKLAYAAWNSKDSKKAYDHFGKAIDLSPDVPDAHFGLAICLQRQGDLPKAVSEFRHSIRLKPSYPEAWFELGETYELLGDSSAAYDAFSSCLAHENSPTRLMSFAHSLWKRRRFLLAKGFFSKISLSKKASPPMINEANEYLKKLKNTVPDGS